MQSWTGPEVPEIAGRPGPLRVYGTAEATAVAVEPRGTARLYVCGITPYDATHLGHAATYLTYDLVVRVWRDAGVEVVYTQNVTDVDDPLLERAQQTGEDWTDLAARETALFRDDMSALRVVPPDHFVGAVESIDRVIDLIARLGDAVYRVDDDLYFDVHADDRFGRIGGYDAPTMRALFAERGGDPDRPGKRDPLDCLVWRAERPDEPAWASDLGRGRPGWHIECAAIALDRLGPDFDVQGGGTDLIFPHHEMSAAEARVATGRPFARTYLHTAMVGYEGEKMSKSQGNLVLVSTLRDKHEAMAIRLALLDHHYRRDWTWSDEEIDDAADRLARWRAALGRSRTCAAEPLIADLRAALTDDLDAPTALAAMDGWCDTTGDDEQAPGEVRRALDALLGIAV